MRFAYIDSQGKEVAIPSVEALQLRIELGAIGEETMFFDGSTDKWAPAKEHEIFRTLSRELREKDEGGFVAPPPPTMTRQPSDTPGQEEPAPSGGQAPAAGEASPTDEPPAIGEPPSPEAASEGPAAVELPSAGLPGEAPAAGEPPTSGTPDETSGPAGGEGEASAIPDGAAEEESPHGVMAAPGGETAAPLDFDLELIEDLPEEPSEGGPPSGGPPAEAAPAGEAGAVDEGLDLRDLEDLEVRPGEEAEAPEEEAPAAGAAPATAEGPDPFHPTLELEPPLSEYDPDHETPWDRGDEPGTELEAEERGAGAEEGPSDEHLGFVPLGGVGAEGGGAPEEETVAEEEPAADEVSAVADVPAADEPPPGLRHGGEAAPGAPAEPASHEPGEQHRPPPRDVPSERPRPKRRGERATHPRRKEESRVGRVVAAVLAVAVLGAAGWFGWDYLQDGALGTTAGAAPAELPPLPDRLRPTWEAAAARAHAALLDSLAALAEGLPEAPDEAWLSGRYLANAGSFPGVERYWATLEGYLERVRDEDESIFLAAFGERLDSLEVPASDRHALDERARAGFRAAEPDRRVLYDQLDTLVRASLDLHDFLVGNEGSIEYEPAAAGLSRDPVTEAVPATEELGDRMWDQVAEITAALDDLGALERVSTDRLTGIVLEKLSTARPR